MGLCGLCLSLMVFAMPWSYPPPCLSALLASPLKGCSPQPSLACCVLRPRSSLCTCSLRLSPLPPQQQAGGGGASNFGLNFTPQTPDPQRKDVTAPTRRVKLSYGWCLRPVPFSDIFLRSVKGGHSACVPLTHYRAQRFVSASPSVSQR